MAPLVVQLVLGLGVAGENPISGLVGVYQSHACLLLREGRKLTPTSS